MQNISSFLCRKTRKTRKPRKFLGFVPVNTKLGGWIPTRVIFGFFRNTHPEWEVWCMEVYGAVYGGGCVWALHTRV
jgi:hypothetical protein